jgi:hypothetical protein
MSGSRLSRAVRAGEAHGHRLVELRSIAYHEEIARRLLADPSVLTRARERVEGWLAEGGVHRRWADAWADVLRQPPEQVAKEIVRDDERGLDLRQCTPFAGALSPRERAAIWREVTARERRAAQRA